ncbi:ATP-binding protein [Bacillus weihaiensis]|uniref:ATP-binding protein n=1 Tax=Bacillus weihaiensis TaxID=1547283 RepID=UPI000932B704|nr:ATP-binding protein [Bacillus weihaiensis]
MLPQPLENKTVTISRVHSTVTYPTNFIFIAAMNPCPCGYFGTSGHYCTCTYKQIKPYKNRVSVPILDRFNILFTLQAVKLIEHHFKDSESPNDIKKRVISARKI